MLFSLLADGVLLVHLGFICFVVLGGFLVLARRAWAWFHLPAAVWGIAIEWGGWVCPLTPLENWLRRRAGGEGFQGGFVEHYLLPVIYPSGLTREVQIALGLLVLAINLALYTLAWRRYSRPERS